MQTLYSNDVIGRLNEQFEGRSPEALLDWATNQFGQQLVLTCSFGGASGMVLLDMLVRLNRSTPVVFLDTDLLFPETYALAEAAARHYGITITRHRPALSLEQQAQQEGPELYGRDPDRCCGIRKVTPLAEALAPYDAWVSGIRRDQTTHRAATPLIQWSVRHGLLKISPLVAWSEHDVWRYIHQNKVPYNPLLDQGYRSIGCAPCTHPATSADARSGRWNGFAKTECGIHL